MRWIGLGLAAGAISYPAAAQVRDTSRVRPDSTRLRIPIPPHGDSLIRRDSTGLPRNVPLPEPSDSIESPLAHAPVPRLLPSDRWMRLDREQMFASGALTLQDLLEQVSIVTPITTGYISAPTIAAVAGNARRVRVFVDGIERDALDPRSNGVIDLSQVPLWPMEDVTIERAGTEVRVHLRTWRVDRQSAYTRTDIGTGDQQTNLYRAFYGRRFGAGGAVQFGAQQYSTTPPRELGASADQLGLIGRIGWAGKTFSVDGFVNRVGRNRGEIRAFFRIDSLPGLESRRTDAYLRFGYRDADTSALWGQVIASHAAYNFNPPTDASATTDTIKRDTTQSQAQYLIAVGTNRGSFAASAGSRVRRANSKTLFTPVLSASYGVGGLNLRATVEGKAADSLARAEAAGEFLLVSFARVGVAADRISDHGMSDASSLGARAWAGLRLGDVWIDGGIIRRDSARLVAPGAIGAVGDTIDVPANGLTLSAVGRVWKALYANASAVRWDDTAGLYRPKYQTRSELFVRTNLIERFPTGNFGLLVSGRHEYRSATLIPNGATGQLRATGLHTLSTLLEIRIYRAVVSWQVRNVAGLRNYQAPDYLLPRTTNFYGVRWEFWN